VRPTPKRTGCSRRQQGRLRTDGVRRPAERRTARARRLRSGRRTATAMRGQEPRPRGRSRSSANGTGPGTGGAERPPRRHGEVPRRRDRGVRASRRWWLPTTGGSWSARRTRSRAHGPCADRGRRRAPRRSAPASPRPPRRGRPVPNGGRRVGGGRWLRPGSSPTRDESRMHRRPAPPGRPCPRPGSRETHPRRGRRHQPRGRRNRPRQHGADRAASTACDARRRVLPAWPRGCQTPLEQRPGSPPAWEQVRVPQREPGRPPSCP
jgi:hypothetical protein